MDFIKGNEQVKIDPSGIDISGTGHIFIDSNSVTGDISFINDSFIINSTGEITINANNRVNFPSLMNKFGQGVHSVNIMDGNIDIGEKFGVVDTKLFIHGHSYNSNPGSHVIYSKGGGFQTSDPYSEFIQRGFHFSSGAGSPLFKFKLSDWDVDDNNIPSNEPGILVEGKGGENFFRVNQNGNVGIGVTDPLEKLDVDGNIIIRATTSANDGGQPYNAAGHGIFFRPNYTPNGTGDLYNCSITAHAHDAASSAQSADGICIAGNDGISFRTSMTEQMRITTNGYIGIGTTNPLVPLEVRGRGLRWEQFASEGNGPGLFDNNHYSRWIYFTSYGAAAGGGIYAAGGSYNTNSSTPTDPIDDFGISIRCEGSMWLDAPIFFTSDARIKTDISNIDDDKALQQVNRLESKEYHYIDPEHRRLMKTIGFIAQEVKKVIPNAVSIQKNWVPDEMRIITDPQWTEDAGKYYLNIPDLDMSGAFTGKAKFYVSNDPSGNDEVCKEVDIKEVPTTSMNEFSTTNYVAEFDQSWNNVFFYGKEVSDFHTLDKNQIFALHHSAIQELDRKHEREVAEKNNKIQNLEGEVSNLTGQVSSLTSRLEALEASVLSLQNN